MRQRLLTVERLEHVARQALIGGYGRIIPWSETDRFGLGSADPYAGRPRRVVELLCSMDCEQPYEAVLHARYSATHDKRVKPLTVVIHSRCRKCTACRERRSMFWKARAFTEYQKSIRTLFGTLTIRPEWDVILDARCRVRLYKKGVTFDTLPPEQMFAERVVEGGREITAYLKRLRGDAKSARRPAFRYLLIAEAHNGAKTSDAKRGRPHWHVLFHETNSEELLVQPHEWYRDKAGNVVSDRYGNALVDNSAFLKSQWKLGYSNFCQAGTPQAALYLCKYLTKETGSRVRASFRYGAEAPEKTSERDSATISDAESRSVNAGPTLEEGKKNEVYKTE